ncbi:hypothetical protein OKW43_008508 [Paraburkholderia sp. WC7.3g]|uniref:hypothetical protein n=1 Tax=Paraburkholderia sp. WC7.3g TaxID=2991070 RepID=UPI003D218256
MNPSDWLDTGCRPPQRLPGAVDAALEYLAHALGHSLYCRWTLATLKRGRPSLADAVRSTVDQTSPFRPRYSRKSHRQSAEHPLCLPVVVGNRWPR